MCRGYYTRAVLAAWDWRDGKLTSRWVFDSDDGTPGNRDYRGQGNHSVSVADVDGDGKDEIVYGACVIDDNGKGLFSTRLGHGDALHVTDLDPARPGLEVWGIHENEQGDANRGGHALCTTRRTGEVLFTRQHRPGRRPRHGGRHRSAASGRGTVGRHGRPAGTPRASASAPRRGRPTWPSGGTAICCASCSTASTSAKWDYENGRESRSSPAASLGLASNNGSKSNPCLSADILGDWREELIARTADGRELRIFTTTIPTEHRLPTLMHDPQYRLSIAWQNVAYNQPPHTGYYLGPGMQPPPSGSHAPRENGSPAAPRP